MKQLYYNPQSLNHETSGLVFNIILLINSICYTFLEWIVSKWFNNSVNCSPVLVLVNIKRFLCLYYIKQFSITMWLFAMVITVYFAINFLKHRSFCHLFTGNIYSHNKTNIFTNLREAMHEKVITRLREHFKMRCCYI